MRITELQRKNALATVSLPAYLLMRPWLKLQKRLRAQADGPWVFGGHSGRLHADNAAAVHARAHELGREVYFVVQSEALEQELRTQGYRTLRRNSTEARIAIENAAVLVYSHGLSDLDHLLTRVVKLRGLKVHLFHTLTFLKAAQTKKQAEVASNRVKEPLSANRQFDYLLAITPRERANMARLFPAYDERIILGGGAHLDPFMRQRRQRPARTLVYCPTHRDSPSARRLLEQNIKGLVGNTRLLDFLEREDLTLEVVAHVNRAAHDDGSARLVHPRIRWVPPNELLDSVLRGAAFISDYSGLLFDQLALDRPTIFFPFDRSEYLKERQLFIDYDELSWGPHVHEVGALVDLIVSGRYRELAPYEAERRYWEKECFSHFTTNYAAESLNTIDALAARADAAAQTDRQSNVSDSCSGAQSELL